MNTIGPRFQTPGLPTARPASGEPAPAPDKVSLGEPAEHHSGLKMGALALLAIAGAGALAGCSPQEVQESPAQQKASHEGQVTGLLLAKGRVDADGTIHDVLGITKGYVKDDGRITDVWGIGKGRVDADGTVRGVFGVSHGSVSSDGIIRDVFGIQQGRVQGADDSRVEQREKGGAALLLLLQDKDN